MGSLAPQWMQNFSVGAGAGAGSAAGSGSTTGAGSAAGAGSITGAGSTTGGGSTTGAGSATGAGSTTGAGAGVVMRGESAVVGVWAAAPLVRITFCSGEDMVARSEKMVSAVKASKSGSSPVFRL